MASKKKETAAAAPGAQDTRGSENAGGDSPQNAQGPAAAAVTPEPVTAANAAPPEGVAPKPGAVTIETVTGATVETKADGTWVTLTDADGDTASCRLEAGSLPKAFAKVLRGWLAARLVGEAGKNAGPQ